MGRGISKKYAKIISILLMFIFVAVSFFPAVSAEEEQTTQKVSEQYTFQEIAAHFDGDYELPLGPLSLNAGFSITGGIDFPVNSNLVMPSKISPGGTADVIISMEGQFGSFWIEYSVYGGGSISSVTFADLYWQDRIDLMSFLVPIGINAPTEGESLQIPIYTNDLVVAKITLKIQFKFGMLMDFTIGGDVKVEGGALDNSLTEDYIWSGLPYMNSIPISEDASIGDELRVEAENLRASLNNLRIWFKSIILIAEIDFPFLDPIVYDIEFPLEDLFQTGRGTRQDGTDDLGGDDGEFMNLQNSYGLTSLTAFVVIGGVFGIFYMFFLIFMAITDTVITLGIIQSHRKSK